MTLHEREDARSEIEQRRKAPVAPAHVVAAFDGAGKLDHAPDAKALTVTIECTNGAMELAYWLTDDWWATLMHHWADRAITIHIAPTPAALLNPVVLHQLTMLRRVAVSWRIVGQAYVDDVITDEAVTELAQSPYHEVRFSDCARVPAPPSDRSSWAPGIEDLFGRLRREQIRLGRTMPILVRLPADRPEASSICPQVNEGATVPAASPKVAL
jgi:hypothetical protein